MCNFFPLRVRHTLTPALPPCSNYSNPCSRGELQLAWRVKTAAVKAAQFFFFFSSPHRFSQKSKVRLVYCTTCTHKTHSPSCIGGEQVGEWESPGWSEPVYLVQSNVHPPTQRNCLLVAKLNLWWIMHTLLFVLYMNGRGRGFPESRSGFLLSPTDVAESRCRAVDYSHTDYSLFFQLRFGFKFFVDNKTFLPLKWLYAKQSARLAAVRKQHVVM